MTIEPTVGRVVLFCESPGSDVRLAAIVAKVYDDRMVNLMVIACTGGTWPKTSVLLRQPDDPIPDLPYCEWMPYQVGQAQKTRDATEAMTLEFNALTAQLGERVSTLESGIEATEALAEQVCVMAEQLVKISSVIAALDDPPEEGKHEGG